MSQLALPIALADHAVFESFYDGGNEVLVAMLKAVASGGDEHGCWLWGAPGSGKTHLLQAVCETAGDAAAYLPMASVADYGRVVLDGLSSRNIVCIDDVDVILGNDDFEIALFSLYNALHETGGQLVVAATQSPRESKVNLLDLSSRLSRLPVFQIQNLSDDERIAALQLRAEHRGLSMPDDAAKYLMKHCRRDMASLNAILERIDAAALLAKKPLTLRFVRNVLNSVEQ